MFVVVRLLIAADGDVSRFIVAGQGATSATTVQPTIHVFASYGYDGQFYFRLATNPTELHLEEYHGVRLDSPARVSRIGYPTIAWALSLGKAAWVKWSLVLTNILGLGALAFAGAHLARNYGRPAYVGLATLPRPDSCSPPPPRCGWQQPLYERQLFRSEIGWVDLVA